MPLSLLPSFLYYCFVSGITPGPANLTSLSTALRHGRKKALRQWRGLFTGYFCVSVVSGILTYLVGTQLTRYVKYFSFIGAIYILWLAIHILRDNSEVGSGTAGAKRNVFAEGTFLFGFFVNITNVKIMVFCVTALAGFVLPYTTDFRYIMLIACLLPFTGPLCNLVWLFAGDRLQGVFAKHRRVINILMAASLIVCAVSMVI